MAPGPLHAGLLPWFARWPNHPSTEEPGGGELRPMPDDAVRADREPLLRGERGGWTGFAIDQLPDLGPVGHANRRDRMTPHRTAEFGTSIGNGADRGRGYVTGRRGWRCAGRSSG